MHFKGTEIYVIGHQVKFLDSTNKNPYRVDESADADIFLISDVDIELMNWHSKLRHIGQDWMSRLTKNRLAG